MSRKRSTALEYERRVGEVYTLLLNGLGRGDILQFVSSGKAEWKAVPRQIDNYIAQARQRFIEHANPDRKLELGRALQRLDNLYSRCMKIQDYKACLAVLREKSALLGLNAPTKNEHAGPGGGPIPVAAAATADNPLKDLTDEEIRQLRAIHARRRATATAAGAGGDAGASGRN